MREIELAIDGSVAVITINRSEVRNAINSAAAIGMATALDVIDRRSDVRVGIITGAGGTFSAGMDLKSFLEGDNAHLKEGGFAGITRRKLLKPMIAAVEGFALGGGFEIALACDFIVAAESARFGFPEVSRGLVATAGGLTRLPRQIPIRIAAELVLTGQYADPKFLHMHGLVNRVTPPGEALLEAKRLAASIAANGPLAVAASRDVINRSQDWPLSEMFERQEQITRPVFNSNDAREGAEAFSEKRVPHWTGA